MAEILAPHIFNEPSLEFSSAGTHGLHDYAISWEVERLLQRSHISQMTVDAFRSRRLTAAIAAASCKQAYAQSRTLRNAQRPALQHSFRYDESPLQKKRGLDQFGITCHDKSSGIWRVIRAITCHACANGGASCLSCCLPCRIRPCSSTNRSSNSCRIHGCASRRQG